MEGGINLLPQLTEKEIKAGVYRRKINIAALGFIGAVGVIIVALFGYQLLLTLRAGDIDAKTRKATSKILENRETEIISRSLKEKVEKLQSILSSAIPASELMAQLNLASLTSPEPIRLTSVALSSPNKITVSGKAVGPNPSESLKNWINNLTSGEGEDNFAAITLTNLSGNRTEGYSFDIQMEFLKKGVYEVIKNESKKF